MSGREFLDWVKWDGKIPSVVPFLFAMMKYIAKTAWERVCLDLHFQSLVCYVQKVTVAAGPSRIHRWEWEGGEFWHLAPLLFVICSRMPAHGMMPLSVKLDLHTLVNLIKKLHYSCAQWLVSKVILDLVTQYSSPKTYSELVRQLLKSRYVKPFLMAWGQWPDPHVGCRELTLPNCPLTSTHVLRMHTYHTYILKNKNCQLFVGKLIPKHITFYQ